VATGWEGMTVQSAAAPVIHLSSAVAALNGAVLPSGANLAQAVALHQANTATLIANARTTGLTLNGKAL